MRSRGLRQKCMPQLAPLLRHWFILNLPYAKAVMSLKCYLQKAKYINAWWHNIIILKAVNTHFDGRKLLYSIMFYKMYFHGRRQRGQGGAVPLGFSYMILIKKREAYWCSFSVLLFPLPPCKFFCRRHCVGNNYLEKILLLLRHQVSLFLLKWHWNSYSCSKCVYHKCYSLYLRFCILPELPQWRDFWRDRRV